jgi:hypothetical protein
MFCREGKKNFSTAASSLACGLWLQTTRAKQTSALSQRTSRPRKDFQMSPWLTHFLLIATTSVRDQPHFPTQHMASRHSDHGELQPPTALVRAAAALPELPTTEQAQI